MMTGLWEQEDCDQVPKPQKDMGCAVTGVMARRSMLAAWASGSDKVAPSQGKDGAEKR